MANIFSWLANKATEIVQNVDNAFMSLVASSHVMILDAGSSGTHLYVYQASTWTAAMKEPPQIHMVFQGKKANRGIAKLAPGAVETYLKPIIDEAKVKFHQLGHNNETMKNIRLYMLGTAGMRDLADESRGALEEAINTYLKGCGFDIKAKGGGYSTISSEEEAAYGWIAANWSLGTFVELKQQSPQKHGYLEMGGASTQIVFLPHKNELTPEQLGDGDMTRVTLGGVELDLFLKTYNLGSDKVWNKYGKELISINVKNQTGEYCDPDSPGGRSWGNLSGDKFHGTGDFQSSRFQEKVRRVLNRLTPPQHTLGLRLLDEDLITTLKWRRFVGGANFWYSTCAVFGQDIDGAPKQGLFSFNEYDAEVNRTTMLSWPLLKLRLQSKENIMGTAWFVAAWVKLSTPSMSSRSAHTMDLRMVQVIAGNKEIVQLSLDGITAKHKQAQIDVMKEKAAHYVDEKDPARAKRLEESARAALATAWSMQHAAAKLRSDDPKDKLLSPKDQLVVVGELRKEISDEAANTGDDNLPNMQVKVKEAIRKLGKQPEEAAVTESAA
ncbi:nucleoside phosphatase family-domain-containing protein [Mycena albidolilacea]|uniref:Nucleoside phosphatase family-domain-containing protein n=1 Tax=Mycena albidolilacea TaxID=1033008 RepID=A0AAD7EF92_9AGAR|nr:nucleoside phosphatase family-domain-containing protein [Mycena albidolilacea]